MTGNVQTATQDLERWVQEDFVDLPFKAVLLHRNSRRGDDGVMLRLHVGIYTPERNASIHTLYEGLWYITNDGEVFPTYDEAATAWTGELAYRKGLRITHSVPTTITVKI